MGVATGLGLDGGGGDILHVEASITPGKGALILTGHLGEVMKESAQAALTYARSKGNVYQIKPNSLMSREIHIHVPAGAIPKDGPSAGITMAVAIISSLAGIPVRKDVAMTGRDHAERPSASDRGSEREGPCRSPEPHEERDHPLLRTKKDLNDLPPYVRKKINFVPVKHMDEVLRIALATQGKTRSEKRQSA